MTPSNRDPGTTARSLRRTFLLAASGMLTVLFAAPAPAYAQGNQGVIYFRTTDFTHYLVNGDGTNLQSIAAPSNTTYASARSDYPGGRQYVYAREDGQIPGTTTSYGNLMVWNEAGESKAVTEIDGPLYHPSEANGVRWSNDDLDSFLSFRLYDPSTGLYSIYRAHVTAAEIASVDFEPVTLNDSRLEFVAEFPPGVSVFYDWHPSNTKYYYIDPRVTKRSSNQKIRVKTVGIGATMDDDPIVFDGGGLLVQIRVSPVNEQLVALAIGKGILSVNLVTYASGLIATENNKTFTNMNSPCFSPDGSLVAFGATRWVKNKGYRGISKVPFTGGTITTVTDTPLVTVPYSWTW